MNKTIFLSLAAIVATAGITAAQTAGGPAPAPQADKADKPGDWQQMRARFKAEADTDKDGDVSKAERRAFHQQMRQKHFEKKDQNGDGQLSQDELTRMPEAVFQKLDADQSGGLSADELSKGHHGRGFHKRGHGRHFGRMFKRADADDDGKITREEMRAAAEKLFDRMDTNKDGALTREELKARKGHGKKHGKFGKFGKRGESKGERHGKRAAKAERTTNL